MNVPPFRPLTCDREAAAAHLRAYGIDAGESGLRRGAAGEGPPQHLRDPAGNAVEPRGPPAASRPEA